MAEEPAAMIMTVEPSTQLALPQNNDKKNNNNSVPDKKTGKKKCNVSILKAILMLLRRQPAKSNAAASVASKGTWKRLVSLMRPLHLQTNQSPEEETLSLPSAAAEPPLRGSPSVENFEDVLPPSFPPNVPESDDMSRYASAINLQELEEDRYASAVNLQELDEDNDDDKANTNMNDDDDNDDDDEMIDAKAEVFIAQFYEQMRLQRSNSVLRYNEMTKRSID